MRDGCDPQSVLAQLERVLASRPLRSSPALNRFLRHIVEETLAGRGESITEPALGTGVFGRGEQFNSRLDPIVRVQAHNLRTRLAQYYEGPGAADPIVIELPKRTYVPVFRQGTLGAQPVPPPHPAMAPAAPLARLIPRRTVAAGAAVLLLACATAAIWQVRRHEPAPSPHQPDPAAQDLYIRGRYLMDLQAESALRESVDCFEQSIARDPQFAAAFTGVADAYNMLAQYGYLSPRDGMERARRAAAHALALDPHLAQAHVSLAAIIEAYDWDWSAAESEYRRALELNPGLPAAHLWYGMFLRDRGRLKEALPELRRAAELEPRSALTSLNLAYALMEDGNYSAALEAAQRAVQLAPGLAGAHLLVSSLHWAQAHATDSAAAMEQARGFSAGDPRAMAQLACAYARRGDRQHSTALLRELEQMAQRRYVSPYDLGRVSLALGDEDHAVPLLEAAYRERATGLIFLRNDKNRPFHSPRLLSLIGRVHAG